MPFPFNRSAWPAYAAGGALALSLVSIAASQILLGLAIVLTIREWRRTAMPRLAWLLVGFCLWTLLAAGLSDAPRAAWPQIRKFYVYLIVPCVAAAYAGPGFARAVLTAMGAGGAASALWAVVQYAKKYVAAQNAGVPFTQFYIADRVTGFMSHWMTFGGTMMAVFLVAGAYVLFARPVRWRVWLALALFGVAILLSWARGVQLGALAGAVYLIWHWRRMLVLAVPVVLALGVAVMPEPERGRILSIVKPRGETDSNAHRIALWRTGVEMMKAHPVTGVGPEQVERNFLKYAPADVPRPVPTHWWYGHLHNVYIQFSADRGIPGMLLIVGFFAGSLWVMIRGAVRAGPETGWMLHGIAAVILGILVTGFFEHNLADSEILLLTLGLTTLGHCLCASGRDRLEVS